MITIDHVAFDFFASEKIGSIGDYELHVVENDTDDSVVAVYAEA